MKTHKQGEHLKYIIWLLQKKGKRRQSQDAQPPPHNPCLITGFCKTETQKQRVNSWLVNDLACWSFRAVIRLIESNSNIEILREEVLIFSITTRQKPKTKQQINHSYYPKTTENWNKNTWL